MRCRSESGNSQVVLVVAVVCLLAGCHSARRHYVLQGQVLGKSAELQQITVNHGEIPGFMAAMSMPYPVRDKSDFERVRPGDEIKADIIVDRTNHFWLENVVITDESRRGAISSLPAHELLPGEAAPDLPLTNQDGKQMRLSDLKGKAVLISFIYTRCPFPTFCPLISSNFASINKQLAENSQDYASTHLVSISLDPNYDTPPVMRKYGLSYLAGDAAGFEHWDFVSSSPDDLKKLATAFGLEYFVISHSMETILLNPDGTIARTWNGSSWQVADVLAALRRAAAPKPS